MRSVSIIIDYSRNTLYYRVFATSRMPGNVLTYDLHKSILEKIHLNQLNRPKHVQSFLKVIETLIRHSNKTWDNKFIETVLKDVLDTYLKKTESESIQKGFAECLANVGPFLDNRYQIQFSQVIANYTKTMVENPNAHTSRFHVPQARKRRPCPLLQEHTKKHKPNSSLDAWLAYTYYTQKEPYNKIFHNSISFEQFQGIFSTKIK